MKKNSKIPFDFDVHSKQKYMHYWVKDYMTATYNLITKKGIVFKNKTLLDIGVGRGRALPVYKVLGITKITGIDVDKSEADYALIQAKRLKMRPTIVVDSSNNKKLKSIPDNSYDFVAFMDLLFCLPDHLKNRVIHEAKRIVKPGGIIIAVDMPRPTLMSLTSALSFKPWRFLSHDELLKKMHPCVRMADTQSNYFYCANFIGDILIQVMGPGILPTLNRFFKKMGILGSTRTYLFMKPKA